MWKLFLICVVMSALNSEAATSSSRHPQRRRRAYAGASSGGYASSGGGAGGYTSTYNSGNGGIGQSTYIGTGGYGDYDDYDGFAPNFGIIDPYLFHQQLTSQILAQNYANQQAITGLATAGNAYASADATIDNDDTRIQQQIAAQQAYHNNLVRQNRYRGGSGSSGAGGSGGSSYYNSHRYAPSYAAASGSIGSNGHRQTAYISPANPASPNIVNRFGSSSSGGGGGGGYKGVSVSSFSSSNGDGTSRRGAQTTINDNGKVTSYSVHS